MDADHVWAVLQEQRRMVTWLARVTDLPALRLYDICHRWSWWRAAEAEAISRALGGPRERLFGPRVSPPGRQRPWPRSAGRRTRVVPPGQVLTRRRLAPVRPGGAAGSRHA